MTALTTSGSPTLNGDSSCKIDSTGADRVTAPVETMDETQGWVAVRVKMGYASTADQGSKDTQNNMNYLFAWYDSYNECIIFGWQTPNAAWAMWRNHGGTGGGGTWLSDTFASGDKRTVTMKWTATEIALNESGQDNVFHALANTTIPAVSSTELDIGGRNATAEINSDIIWIAWGTGTLSDSDLATINGWGDTDPSIASFPSGAQVLHIWTADDWNLLDAVTLDSCLPDADVVTTGWTATPLFSKVNDASDATVIQATAV